MTLTKEEMKKILGSGEAGTPFYKLNKVTMSGDSGDFKITDLLSPREQGVKPVIDEMGKSVEGVILKMRWQLSKYDEPNGQYYSSSEYDNKHTDKIMVFPNKDKGSVEEMKAKYALSTQRVIYFYLPKKQQIVRLIVKASALTGDKNPNKEMGLFEYQSDLGDTLLCEVMTSLTGIYREGKNKDGSTNKRKDHYAISFSNARQLTETEFEKVQDKMVEVETALNIPKLNPETGIAQEEEDGQDGIPTLDISPDDIPF